MAANFSETARTLALAFEKKTGNHIEITQGATGALFTQIENGAPFEVFFSADSERPAKLVADGFAIEATRFVYADGLLVLWSAKSGFVDAQGTVLETGQFEHLAIADPAVAPYGVAALEVLKSRHLDATLRAKLVKGASITQTYAYVQSGAAELGFVALSQVQLDGKLTGGSAWIVPEALHTRIRQDAVLLKPGKDSAAAAALLQFLKGEKAHAVISAYGYSL